MEKLFQIGEMAKLFRFSVSSIRHYEDLGLVQPEYVDPDTGYRYYSTRQFEVFHTIRYLRALDMPLSEIRAYVQNRDLGKTQGLLQLQREAVLAKQRELEKIQRKIDRRLWQLDDAESGPLGEIQEKVLPPCRMLLRRQELHISGYEDVEEPLAALVRAQGEPLAFMGTVGLVVKKERLEQGIAGQYDGIFLLPDPEDQVSGEVLELPEQWGLVLRFRGHHGESPAQYARLLDYIRAHHFKISGFAREITLIDYGVTNDPGQFVTEITIPVHSMEEM
jgi:DNA-binding transcriptional MerR regulator